MIMPFGKYKGSHVHQLPEDYLRWLARSGAVRTKELADEIADCLANADDGMDSERGDDGHPGHPANYGDR